jgi:hypothetical protein
LGLFKLVFFPGKLKGLGGMFQLVHRFVRSTILGLMFFLAGTACCWSDSYDPNPYDDIPPVVSVEFNYVIPNLVSIPRPAVHLKSMQAVNFAVTGEQEIAVIPTFADSHVELTSSQSPCHMVIPLRR